MKKILVIAIIAILSFIGLCAGWLWENVNADQIVVNQVPITGQLEVWTEPGTYFQKFGKATVYDKTAQLWFTDDTSEGGVKDVPVEIRFRCGGTAKVVGSLRVLLPRDAASICKIRSEYPTMQDLVDGLVRPTVQDAINASGPMMSAYESYAEKRNDLKRYIEDQVNNGIYQTYLKEERVIDEITGNEKVSLIAYPVQDSLSVNGIKRQTETPPFQEYNIRVLQLAIVDYKYDSTVVKQINTQQQIMMDTKTSYANAMKAKQDAIKAEEVGKAKVAEAEAKAKENAVKEVVEAQKNYEVAEFKAKQAKEDAKRIIAEGEAEAAAARAKVQAGLSPLEKAMIEKETRIGVAAEVAKIQLPKVVVQGGANGSSGTNAMDAMGLKMLLDVADKMSK